MTVYACCEHCHEVHHTIPDPSNDEHPFPCILCAHDGRGRTAVPDRIALPSRRLIPR